MLPIGIFEQHSSCFLPLITDTIVACAISHEIDERYDVLLLPPVTISCSHEHAAFAGTVSISARILQALIDDIAESLQRASVPRPTTAEHRQGAQNGALVAVLRRCTGQ